MLYLTKLLLPIFTGLVLVLTVACSSTTHISKIQCTQGFIQPPGIQKCINIADVIAGRINDPSPLKACSEDWQRLQPKGYCLPKFSIIGCGNKNYTCDSECGEEFRLIPGPPKCGEGPLVAPTDVPLFDENGALLFGRRIVLSCGPPLVGKPV